MVAAAVRFAMKNGQMCSSLRKFLAISSAIQKIASDCSCGAVALRFGLVRRDLSFLPFLLFPDFAVSESTVSNSELSEFVGPHRVPGRAERTQ